MGSDISNDINALKKQIDEIQNDIENGKNDMNKYDLLGNQQDELNEELNNIKKVKLKN